MSLPLVGGGSTSCTSSSTPNWSKVDNKALLQKYKKGAHQEELDRHAFTAFKAMGAEAYLAAYRAGSSGVDESGEKPVAKKTEGINSFIDSQLYAVYQYRKYPTLRTSDKRVTANIETVAGQLNANTSDTYISSRLSSFNLKSVKVGSTNTTDPSKYKTLKQNAMRRYEKNKFSQDFKDIRLASLELIGGDERGDEKRQDGSLNIGLNQDNIWQL